MKRLIPIAVSSLIIVMIYRSIDFQAVLEVFRDSELTWLIFSFGIFIPTIGLTSFRFKLISRGQKLISFIECIKLILAASSLNLILPSKLGDLAKGTFIAKGSETNAIGAFSLVFYEKVCDLLSLLIFCVFGFFFFNEPDQIVIILLIIVAFGLGIGTLLLVSRNFYRGLFWLVKSLLPHHFGVRIDSLAESWDYSFSYFQNNPRLRGAIWILSLLIWILHMAQIWFFIKALGYTIPFLDHLVLIPLSIFAGLLPLSFAGIGVRDYALIFFLKDYLSPATAASLGLLCTTRYLLPALFGLPFLRSYLSRLTKKLNEADHSNSML